MKILILTGNGALVGASFYNEVIKTLNKKHNKIYDKEFPEIVLYNLPLDVNNLGKLNLFDLKVLKNKLFEINNLNIDYLFVLCNSISQDIEDIINTNKFNFKFINIIKNTLAKTSNLNKEIIFCSEYTNNQKIYGKNLNYLEKKEQNIINKIIDNILKGDNNIEELKLITKYLKENNIENIILGCTELYFIKNIFNSNEFNVYDSLTLYKDCLINIILNEN